MAERGTCVVQCDGPDCVATRQSRTGETLDSLVTRLRSVGWLIVEGGDWCPTCAWKATR